MQSYELTQDADKDIESIVRYTIEEWGEAQAKQYLDKLEKCFQKIARHDVISRTFSKRFPQVLVTRYEHHFIFYLHPKKKKPRIFAVLHKRMDLVARMEGRLV